MIRNNFDPGHEEVQLLFLPRNAKKKSISKNTHSETSLPPNAIFWTRTHITIYKYEPRTWAVIKKLFDDNVEMNAYDGLSSADTIYGG